MIDNRVAARVATHCCFTAASSPPWIFTSSLLPPHTPTRPRARGQPPPAHQPNYGTSAAPTSIYLPTYLPYPMGHHTPATCTRLVRSRDFTCNGSLSCLSLAREARNEKSTRNRMAVSVSFMVTLHDIRIENFNI